MDITSDETEIESVAADCSSVPLTHETLDVAFTLFADASRRVVLRDVYEESTTTVAALADSLTARLGETRKAWRVALLHTELPKLATHQVIEFETVTGTVREGPAFDTFWAILQNALHGEGFDD